MYRFNVVSSEITVVTQVDYSTQIQTVAESDHPRYYRLIKAFLQLTGCAVLVNTSFNVRGEPIVCTPENACLYFMRTEMDYLVLGDFLLDRRDQRPLAIDVAWPTDFELD